MNVTNSKETAWLGMGVMLIACALVVNEFVLAGVLSRDGSLESGTITGIRALQGALALSGVGMILTRRSLVALTSRLTANFSGPHALRAILIGGILLRIVVYAYQQPTNNDPHWDFVRFIVDNGRLPIADELTLGFQPPLYYLTAAPFALGGSLKLTQSLSLALGIVNLVLIYRLVRETRLLGSWGARCHALAFAAILPQFVLFSNFISNDALAFPLGTLLCILALGWIERPTRKGVVVLGIVQGAALLTKGTLIGFAPVLILVIAAVEWRRSRRVRRAFASLALFGFAAGSVGCYKFVENQVHFGTPVVGNDILKQEWVNDQMGTYVGISSLVDINVLRLARHPYVSEHTLHSIPLLLYGTFWTGYIHESNFEATRRHPYIHLVRVLYLVGIVPTLLLLLGAGSTIWRHRSLPLQALRPPANDDERDSFHQSLAAVAVVLFLATAVALVLKWGLKHDAWSFFQARLVFPAFLSISLCLGWGYECCARRGPLARYFANAALACAYLVIAAYYAVELGDQCF